MPRENTTTLSTFTRKPQVTYSLPSPPYSSPIVTITLPVGPTWTSGLHWHAAHTEYLAIISGSALVTLSGTTQICTARDGIITVPVNARHEWRRAEKGGEELVVREWTDPEDGEKEVFFRNLNSVLVESENPGEEMRGWVLSLQLFVVFWRWDNLPVFLDCGSVPLVGTWLEWLLTYVVLGFAALVGRVVGLRGWYEDYTPKRVVKETWAGEGKEKHT